MTKSTSKWWAWIAGIALLPLLNSCLQTPEIDNTPTSYVSIYHASPDASGLDISVNDVKINQTSFNYGVFSNYLNFGVGANKIALYTNGSTTKLKDTTCTFVKDRVYSLFIVNRFSKIQILALKDSSQAATTGQARVRFVHLAPDAPAIDVVATGTSSTVLFSDRTFKTATEYLDVNAQTFTLNIRNSDTGATLGTEQSISFVEGRYYTLVVQGFASPPAGNTNAVKLVLIPN